MSQRKSSPSRATEQLPIPSAEPLTAEQVQLQARNASVDELCQSISIDHALFMNTAGAAADTGVRIGIKILAMKDRFLRGEWEREYPERLEGVLGFSLRQAQRYMALAKRMLKASADGQSRNESNKEVLTIEVSAQRQADVESSATASEEWETPEALLIAAREYLGRIDCEPCAAVGRTNHIAEATCVYTRETDGLAAGSCWTDKAWVAPGTDIEPWIQKARSELASGDLNEALLFLPAKVANQSRALSDLPMVLMYSDVILRTPSAEGTAGRTRRMWMTVYLLSKQPDLQRLADAFRDLGLVMKAIQPTLAGHAQSFRLRSMFVPPTTEAHQA